MKWIVDWLSQNIIVGFICVRPMLLINLLNQDASLLALFAAINSNSMVDCAMTGYRCDVQAIAPWFSMNTYPILETLSFSSFAKSASLKP
jgi:hypothetical protein